MFLAKTITTTLLINLKNSIDDHIVGICYMVRFCITVDMCTINAYENHQSCTNANNQDEIDFLKLLANQLYEQFFRERSEKANYQESSKHVFSEFTILSSNFIPKKFYLEIKNKSKKKTPYICI